MVKSKMLCIIHSKTPSATTKCHGCTLIQHADGGVSKDELNTDTVQLPWRCGALNVVLAGL